MATYTLCDRCQKTQPDDVRWDAINISGTINNHHRVCKGVIHLCDDCAKPIRKLTVSFPYSDATSDQLFDTIYEIAVEAVENSLQN